MNRSHGFPRAGMVSEEGNAERRVPRTRGDEPFIHLMSFEIGGTSQEFPARAGMNRHSMCTMRPREFPARAGMNRLAWVTVTR